MPNSPHLSVVEAASWKLKRLFSKLYQPELLMESFIHEFWLQIVAKAPTIVHNIPTVSPVEALTSPEDFLEGK